MRAFVDESGDTGFKFSENSKRYFVMALVVFADEDQANLTRQRIDRLRQELRAPNIEFHFGKNKDTIRRAFLAAVRGCDFTAYVVVADKTKLPQGEYQGRDTFYQSISGVVFEGAKEALRDAHVLFDESGGKKFKRELAAYLKRKINSPQNKRISQVGTADSTADNLLQLADYVCGAAARTVEEGDAQYQELLKRRLIVRQWPD